VRVDKNIGIVGGVIGGIAAAVALRQVGIHVVVYEKAPRLREVGAGMFRGWHEPITDFIDATNEPEILKNKACDFVPLRSRGRGLVTLLGDAAHSCTPNLGPGGCMALEDALVLA
jgi:2-polyprenyl-6-methoxyphenol hydroxylase-like FAD-dependent oxidoreductase